MKKSILFALAILFFSGSVGGFLFAQENKSLLYPKTIMPRESLILQSHEIKTVALRKRPHQKIPLGQSITVPIFMYHHIRELTENMTSMARGLSITPENLDAQLEYFQNEEYSLLTLEELFRSISSEHTPQKKSIVLTFDDGYRDFYQYAFPLFKKYGLRATVFLIVNDIGSPDYLTWEHIQEMDASGLIEFGSHTLTHPELSKKSTADQKKEITESKKILEEKLGKKINFFCYPYGKYTQVTADIVHDAGYTAALTTHFGIRHGSSNIFELPRVRIGNGDVNGRLQKKMEKLLNL